MLKLIYLDDSGSEKEAALGKGCHILGRSSSCNIVLTDPSISGQHLRIDVSADQAARRALRSRTGTKLNGAKVEMGVLSPGDVLVLGRFELRVPGGAKPATPPAAVAAAAAEAEPDATPPALPDVDELPPAGENLPVLRATNAVVVVPPAPVSSEAKRKKLILIGAGAALAVGLTLILLLPSGPAAPTTKKPAVLDERAYWRELESGLSVLRERKYTDAHERLADLDKRWRATHPGEALEAARVFAAVAAPFAAAARGEFPQTDWLRLDADLISLLDRASLPGKGLEREAEEQEALCRREAQAQDALVQGQNLEQQKKFDEARAKYEAIPADSLYRLAVAERLTACTEGEFSARREEARDLARRERWSAAAEAAERALKLKEDAELSTQIREWTDNARLNESLKKLEAAVAGSDRGAWRRAEEELKRLRDQYPQHPILLRRADGLAAELADKAYLVDLAGQYVAANEEQLAKMAKQPQARQPEAAAIFEKHNRLRAEFRKADVAATGHDYWTAREVWSRILEMEPDTNNQYNRRARQSLDEWTIAKLGEQELAAAQEAKKAGRYGEARKHLEIAAQRCNLDVTGEVEDIQKTGKKLYNEAINLVLQGLRWEGKMKLEKALECFLPTEEWFTKIRQRLDRDF